MQWLAEICVHRPVFATVIVLLLTVVGGFSFFTLGVDRFPKIDLPTISVSTSNPGAAPEQIETEVTDIIEGAVNTVPGIEEMRSSSSQGRSNVTLTFSLEKDPDQAFQEVQQKLEGVLNRLPEDTDPPSVRKSDPDSSPVLIYTVSAPRSIVELTDLVQNQIVERIENSEGVGEVQIFGARQREIKIYVNPERLRAYNLPVTQVVSAVRSQNAESPGGSVMEGARTTALRTLSKITRVEDFNDIVVATRNGYPIKIKDIGRVVDGGVEPSSAASLNSVPSVSVAVRKQSGSNTIELIRGVKERMAQIQPTLPKDLNIALTRDQSEFIENSLHAIEEHLVIGGILAAVVVFFFLWNVRSTIISALAIPTSIIASFAAIAALGYSLNQMTMLALTLMVGIVIDDAIVVLENIYRFVEEKGMDPFQAAIEGTREIGLAVLATTLSLMAVFVPIGFMQGIVGRFMSSFGLTSSFAVGVSLIVSFTLTPMLAARLIKRKKADAALKSEDLSEVRPLEARGDGMLESDADQKSKVKGQDSKDSRFYRYIDGTYTWLLKFSMAHRWLIVLLCVAVFLSIVPLFMFVGKNFLPVDDQSQFEVSIRAPEGYSLQATSALFERIASDIRRLEGVTDTLTTIGGGQQQVVNNGSIYVKLTDIGERSKSQEQLMVETRELLKNYPGELRTSVQQVAAFSGGGFRNANVQFLISGPDLKKLEEYSAKLLEKLKAAPDAVDVDSTLISGKPEVRLIIDRDTAADLGVRVGDISQALNTLVAGQEATTFNEGNEQYEVRVRAVNTFRTDVEGLKRLIVPSSKIGWVTLDRVVKVSEGTSPSSIERTNRQRQVTLLANTRPGGSAANIQTALNNAVKELNLPAGYQTGYVGQSKEMARAGFYFLLAIVLSFVFMYIVLAAQFESFIHPVTILLTLPLSIPFGIVSLLIAGQTVNIFSGLGLLLLFGVVKKNAILQIDHTNGLRAKGMNRYDAIIQANRDRLRPILMTTIALVAGMIPLVVSTGAGAGTNRSIGVLVVGGQSLCLLLTLLAVPVFYSIFDDISEFGIFRRIGRLSDWLFGGLRRKVAAATSSLFGKQ